MHTETFAEYIKKNYENKQWTKRKKAYTDNQKYHEKWDVTSR
jgi:hypothetical protein